MIHSGAPAELTAYADDPELIVFEATAPGDVMRIRREIAGRRWAVANGVPSAETVAVDPDGRWMVSRRLTDRPGESLRYLENALEASLRIQRAPAPGLAPANAWAAPRSAAFGNAAKLARAGVTPWEYVRTRADAEGVPATVPIHNDFHRNNVLRGDDDTAAVIDWEYLDHGPIHRDFLLLLTGVRDDVLARQGWDLLRGATARSDHVAMARQVPWLALRSYAIEICDPEYRRPSELAHHRKRWRLVKEWAAEVLT